MSTNIRVVAPVPPEVAALSEQCRELASQSSLEKFEIAVKSRLERGINDDNDLRIVDDLLHQVVLGADALEANTKPAISAAHALHKALIAAVDPWKKRWSGLADSLKGAILRYRRAQEELAARQQRELELAAEAERKRKEQAARALLREGNVSAAKEFMEEAAAIVAPVIVNATPSLDNSTMRKPWQVKITNPEAVVKAIAAGVIPLSAIKEFNLTFLKAEAKTRGGLNWPGIEAWQEDALSVRR